MNTLSETSSAPRKTPMQQIADLVAGDSGLEQTVERALRGIVEMMSFAGDEPSTQQPDGTWQKMDVEAELKKIYLEVAVEIQRSSLDDAKKTEINAIIQQRLSENTYPPLMPSPREIAVQRAASTGRMHTTLG